MEVYIHDIQVWDIDQCMEVIDDLFSDQDFLEDQVECILEDAD